MIRMGRRMLGKDGGDDPPSSLDTVTSAKPTQDAIPAYSDMENPWGYFEVTTGPDSISARQT